MEGQFVHEDFFPLRSHGCNRRTLADGPSHGQSVGAHAEEMAALDVE